MRAELPGFVFESQPLPSSSNVCTPCKARQRSNSTVTSTPGTDDIVLPLSQSDPDGGEISRDYMTNSGVCDASTVSMGGSEATPLTDRWRIRDDGEDGSGSGVGSELHVFSPETNDDNESARSTGYRGYAQAVMSSLHDASEVVESSISYRSVNPERGRKFISERGGANSGRCDSTTESRSSSRGSNSSGSNSSSGNVRNSANAGGRTGRGKAWKKISFGGSQQIEEKDICVANAAQLEEERQGIGGSVGIGRTTCDGGERRGESDGEVSNDSSMLISSQNAVVQPPSSSPLKRSRQH